MTSELERAEEAETQAKAAYTALADEWRDISEQLAEASGVGDGPALVRLRARSDALRTELPAGEIVHLRARVARLRLERTSLAQEERSFRPAIAAAQEAVKQAQAKLAALRWQSEAPGIEARSLNQTIGSLEQRIDALTEQLAGPPAPIVRSRIHAGRP